METHTMYTIRLGLLLLMVPLTTHAQEKTLFGLKVDKTPGDPGDYVLCPSRQFFDNAIKNGADKTTFIYYAARLVESDKNQTTVKNLAGRTFSLPSEMVLPIPKGQTAKVGDVLLTWWQTGSGMQRAIVVGGKSKEPVVRYLDIKLDNPSGAGKREDRLKPDSFVVLSKPWQLGTTLRIKDTKRPNTLLHGQIVALDNQRVLIKGWNGKLSTHERAHAIPVPIVPQLAANDAIQISLFGSFKPATVVKVDKRIGRVFAKYQFGRQDKEAAFAFGDVYAE